MGILGKWNCLAAKYSYIFADNVVNFAPYYTKPVNWSAFLCTGNAEYVMLNTFQYKLDMFTAMWFFLVIHLLVIIFYLHCVSSELNRAEHSCQYYMGIKCARVKAGLEKKSQLTTLQKKIHLN